MHREETLLGSDARTNMARSVSHHLRDLEWTHGKVLNDKWVSHRVDHALSIIDAITSEERRDQWVLRPVQQTRWQAVVLP